jgi:hypothetical protein
MNAKDEGRFSNWLGIGSAFVGSITNNHFSIPNFQCSTRDQVSSSIGPSWGEWGHSDFGPPPQAHPRRKL